jgi:hypothetical protein
MKFIHMVLMKIKSDVSESSIAELYTALADLQKLINGITDFTGVSTFL